MTYCKNCGAELQEDQVVCPQCGTHMNQQTEQMNEASYTQDFSKEQELRYQNQQQTSFSNNEKGYQPPEPLSNWVKVTLAVLIPVLPGLGALIGIIASIIFMNHSDKDRKTFGHALLTYSIIFLVILCGCCMFFYAAGQQVGPELEEFINGYESYNY